MQGKKRAKLVQGSARALTKQLELHSTHPHAPSHSYLFQHSLDPGRLPAEGADPGDTVGRGLGVQVVAQPAGNDVLVAAARLRGDDG